jgi:hypothetical protein
MLARIYPMIPEAATPAVSAIRNSRVVPTCCFLPGDFMGLASAAASDGESEGRRNGSRCAARARFGAREMHIAKTSGFTPRWLALYRNWFKHLRGCVRGSIGVWSEVTSASSVLIFSTSSENENGLMM